MIYFGDDVRSVGSVGRSGDVETFKSDWKNPAVVLYTQPNVFIVYLYVVCTQCEKQDIPNPFIYCK